MMTEDEEQERRPPCGLSKDRELNCKLNYGKSIPELNAYTCDHLHDYSGDKFNLFC